MKKVVITGGSGLLGPYVVDHFIEMGYDVLSVDITKPQKSSVPFQKVDLMNLGECYGVLAGADAVVHLAAPKTRKTGYAAALSLIFGAIVTNLLLKNIVARPRPFAEIEALIPMITKPKDFSFPSGHTTASFAVALVMLRMLPKKFGIPAVVLAALVAFSRLYLGVHYPTDVLTGFVIALVGSMLSVWIVRTKPEDKQVH